MNQELIYTVLLLVALGALAAIILYWVSQKFKVQENPKLEQVLEALPNTNCGGCGFPGCSAFADALVNADDLAPYNCPVGGNEVMKEVGEILGKAIEEKDPFVAVVKCAGAIHVRVHHTTYDGAANCSIASNLYSGERGCSDGCVGLGECVEACTFDAMYMDETTGLPVVIEDKCTSCNACVTACPKDIIELWPKGKRDKKIYIACVNEEKGGTARKECSMACSGCAKCVDECKYDAITVENDLAKIDYDLCKLCGKCIVACDVGNIVSTGFKPEMINTLAEKREKRLEKEKEAKRLEREKAKEVAEAEKENVSDKPES